MDAEARLRRLFGDDEPPPGDSPGSDPDEVASPGELEPGDAAPLDMSSPWIGGPAEDVEATAVHPAATAPVVPEVDLAGDRRRQLWRDSATILIGVVVALLVGQAIFPPVTGEPGASPTELPSGISIGSVGPPRSLPPGATLGPIVDPSLGVDATGTPIPVITMGPTPTASPTPAPTSSAKASASPKPSKTPGSSVKPSGPPPTQPPPTAPPPTPAPPEASFTWSATLLLVDFTSTSSGDESWEWDFGDSSGSTAHHPSHLYAAPGDYTVTLTVTGPGGTDTFTDTVTVAGE